MSCPLVSIVYPSEEKSDFNGKAGIYFIYAGETQIYPIDDIDNSKSVDAFAFENTSCFYDDYIDLKLDSTYYKRHLTFIEIYDDDVRRETMERIKHIAQKRVIYGQSALIKYRNFSNVIQGNDILYYINDAHKFAHARIHENNDCNRVVDESSESVINIAARKLLKKTDSFADMENAILLLERLKAIL